MKYAPGLMVGQLSGHTGSTVASHNRYGSYFRSRTIPTNPNSAIQQFRRAAFTAAAQRWRELTESQRSAWADLAIQLPRIGPLGITYILTGLQQFSAINLLRSVVGFASIDDAPGIDAAPDTGLITLTATQAAGGTMEVAYTAVGGLAGNRFVVWATAPRSPGKTYVSRGEMKVIDSFAGNAASPRDIQAAYEAVFGAGWLVATVAGMEIVVRTQGISANGLPSGFQEDVALIA